MRRFFRNLPRAGLIISLLCRYFLIPFLIPRRRRTISWPLRMRLALEQLGGAWVKLGQMLALRFDLLPAAFCHELFKLLNQVPPFGYSAVREIVKQELGDYPEVIFRTFEEEPFASASIGQVHRAVLRSGERVAVKVQRPNIREVLRTDIDLMYALQGIIDRTHIFGYTPTREVIDEFARWTLEELDYLVEARHCSTLHQNAADDPLERIPKVYWQYSSSKVLTSELLEGVPLVEIMRAVWSQDTAYLQDLKARGYDLLRVVQRIDWNMLNQMYINGYFHADIHPANIIVLPDNVIGYVDFGIIGMLADDVRESLIQYTWYFFQGNAERAVEQLLRWITPSRFTNLAQARSEMIRTHEDFRFSLDDPGPTGVRESASAFAINNLVTIRRNGMVLAPPVLAYVRTLVTADTLRTELAPEHDFLRLSELFFSRMISQQAREWLDPRRAITGAFDYSFRLRQVLGIVEAEKETGEALTSLVVNTRRRAQALARAIRMVGLLALVVGIVIIFLRLNPELTTTGILSQMSLDWFSGSLLAVVTTLVAVIIFQRQHIREEIEDASRVQKALQRQWEEPQQIKRNLRG
jgi:ubiquinone biosynthesis protein